ncbi:MAG: SulP family inorganic anion transporter, partial [Polyangiales bacterium]
MRHLHRRLVTSWRQLSLTGALTIALVGVPQCLAYAMMAGIPPAYGLSTAVVAGLVCAWLGQSRQVVTAPTSTTALILLSALSPWLH